ncbi:MAG: RNA polymerase sigma factor [Gemmatimonadota bacterium]
MPAAQVRVSRDPDAADVARASGGDTEAFERLYRRHVSAMHSLARRLAGEAEAEELTQDVFVRTWQKLHTFRGEAAFSSWLYRLAVNVIYARLRSESARRSRLTFDETAVARAGRGRGGEPVDVKVEFERAIETLPGGAREVFVLHDVEGYKHREIAEMLSISPGTSKSQLHRARMILRHALGGTR